MNKNSILIVDDDSELLEMLGEYLSAEGFRLSTACDGAKGAEVAETDAFDLIILDVMLPSMTGYEVLKRIRTKIATPVLMLTARGAEIDRILGLELGADDYLPKPFSPRELVARIRAILRRVGPEFGETARDGKSRITTVGRLKLDATVFEARIDGEILPLTGTEFRILEVLCGASGQIVSRDALTEQVLSRKLTPYDRAIDTHVSNLRRKFEAVHAGDFDIKSIRGVGYLLVNLTGPK